jgi:glycogen synthase
LKIAFISYEYPPDTAWGGIATYVHQAARMLTGRGHQVEVFAGSLLRAGLEIENGVAVHRVMAEQQGDFAVQIGQCFAARHALVGFDVLEGPDYSADAREAVRRVPDIPLVLKLHTPKILLLRLNYRESSFFRSVRLYLRSLRGGLRPAWGYDPDFSGDYEWAMRGDAIEREHALQADEIASPSRSLGDMLVKEWGLDRSLVSHVPYPFDPVADLLRIPVETRTNRVTFIGRLEVRKGVIDMAKAIPQILRRHPATRFRFVGASEPSPIVNVNMRDYLEEMLRPNREMVEFTGNLAYERIPAVLAETDVCVFPSYWENFPCVCLEAMAAARGIVASNAGGMDEMLAGGRIGLTVPPRRPRAIAAGVSLLLGDPSRRMRMGETARERLLSVYGDEQVGILQESSYKRAIARRRRLGARQSQAREAPLSGL